MPAAPSPAPSPQAVSNSLVVPVLIGAAVAVALGVYGRLHEPTGFAVNLAGFSSTGYVKAWLATIATLFGIVQLLSSLVMYGRLLAAAPPWIDSLHRWSGRLAVLASVPVAMHCLYALGFQAYSARVLVHSLAGCLFYGAFTTKMLCLTRPNLPRGALPVLGGLAFTGLVVLWLTSSLWLFSTKGLKF
ncbi:MAG: hypothetical protein JO100_01985 [Pseudonocardia sp.]|nr:hypothetical protein [Pseudonocardia sp.]